MLYSLGGYITLDRA